MINPSIILSIKKRKAMFEKDHPEFTPFLKKSLLNFVKKDSVISISIQNPSGEKTQTQIKLSENDIKTLEMILKK